MAELDTIGVVEVSSIGAGFVVEDTMLKAAAVDLLVARTICSGKFIVVVAGDVASVQASVEAGAAAAEGSLIDRRIISRIHPSVFPAISGVVDLKPEDAKAVGLIETFSATSIIGVADAAAKAANVLLFKVHLAMAIGGKGFVVFTGDLADVEAAVAAGSEAAAEEGILVSRGVIPAPHRALFRDFI